MSGGFTIDDLDTLKRQVKALLEQFDEVEKVTSAADRVRANQDSSTWSTMPSAQAFATQYRTEMQLIVDSLAEMRHTLEDMSHAIDKGADDLESLEDEVATMFGRLADLTADTVPAPPPAPLLPSPVGPLYAAPDVQRFL